MRNLAAVLLLLAVLMAGCSSQQGTGQQVQVNEAQVAEPLMQVNPPAQPTVADSLEEEFEQVEHGLGELDNAFEDLEVEQENFTEIEESAFK